MTRMEPALVVIAVGLGVAVIVLRVMLGHARDRVAAAEGRLALTQADAAVAQARLEDLQRVLGEADKLRQDMTNAAKAAALEAATALSSKLIDDHKRETAEAHQRAEASIRQVTQPIVEQFGKINEAVATLNSQVQDKGRALDTIQRALSSPGGAGQIAEVGLGNMLRAFGLEEGRDFALQFTATSDAGKDLRPDALVFLPGDTLIVIDCKASMFLMQIAEAGDAETEEQAYRNLAVTMNGHLKALAGKNYQGAVQASWRASGRGPEAARVLSIMYVPSETAIEKVKRADPEFQRKARDAGISLAGPNSLHFAISLAAVDIRGQRRAESQAEIVDQVAQLLDSLRTVLDATAKVGRGIETAANSFADLARSVNARLLPRARRLQKYGVDIAKPLPPTIPAIAVNRLDSTIEGEAEEVPPPAPPRLVAE
jgi:DNA recombination protein RmuC